MSYYSDSFSPALEETAEMEELNIKTGNTTWGRNQILELMDRLEREMIREFERGE